MEKQPRATISKETETAVLTASRRRCCLCYYLDGRPEKRKGQIAHINQERSDASCENLVWLCLEHHDEFDSSTSQSKGITPEEVKKYRDRLHRELASEEEKVEEYNRTNKEPVFVQQLLPELKQVLQGAKGELDWMLGPWDLPAWDDVRSFLFAYKASNHMDGICRVERIYLKSGMVAVICKHMEEAPGQSITNSIEELSFQVCAQFRIHPEQLVMIEYYARSAPGKRYSLVSFHTIPPAGMFAGPSWRDMTPEDWQDLKLRPRS